MNDIIAWAVGGTFVAHMSVMGVSQAWLLCRGKRRLLDVLK